MTPHSPLPPQPQLTAVLWDLDGTLVDSEPLWLRAEEEMLARYGLTLDTHTRHQLIGCALSEGARLFQNLGVPLSIADIISEWSHRVTELTLTTPPSWRPGAHALLLANHAAGIRNTVVTMATRTIAESVIARLPEGVVSGLVAGDDGKGAKPDPQPYLAGAALADTTIAQCVAIEDSPTGVRAAAASGAVTIAVTHMLPLDTVPAHIRLDSLCGVSPETLTLWHTQYFGSTPRTGSVTHKGHTNADD